MTKSNSKIARMFAEGKTKGKGNHMFIKGDGIYSYGDWYPIAKRGISISESLKDVYILNSNAYSFTTTRHKQLVFHALNENGNKIVQMIDCEIGNANLQRKMNEQMIDDFKEKMKNARTKHGHYKKAINACEQQNKLIDEHIIPIILARRI